MRSVTTPASGFSLLVYHNVNSLWHGYQKHMSFLPLVEALQNHQPRWVFLCGLLGHRSKQPTGPDRVLSNFCSFRKGRRIIIFFWIIKLALKYMNTRQAPQGKDALCLEKRIQFVLSTGLGVKRVWPSDDNHALFLELRGTRHTIKEARHLQFTFRSVIWAKLRCGNAAFLRVRLHREN